MVQSQHGHRPPLRPVLETYVNVTAAAYTAKAGDRVIGVNRAGAVTVTLPTTEVRKGRVYTVKDESGAAATNNITVATEGSETIDGSATDTIGENYGAKTYYSDGSNWFNVPILAVGPHTLASHSAKAHSDLTGVGTDDHHAKAHQADHNNAGADALKLDDLAATDDNTDLDFSTTKHGLVPKGTNTGNFLKDDGTWAAAGGALKSTIVTGTRTAAAGTGDQAITGAGFTPTTLLIWAVEVTSTVYASWGFGDDAVGEAMMRNSQGTPSFSTGTADIINIDPAGGSGSMVAVVKTLDSDGCTLTWTKTGAASTIRWLIMFLR